MNKNIKKIATASLALLSMATMALAAAPAPGAIQMKDMTINTAVDNLVTLIFSGMVLAAIVVIAWSGYDMVISQGDPAKVTKAKEQISWAITGIVITVFAYIIIQLVFQRFATGWGN